MTTTRMFAVVILAFLTVLVGCQEKAPEEPVASVLTLSVSSGPQVILGGDAIELSELESALRASTQKRATYIVYDIAPDTPAAAFHDVFRQVRNAGVAGVGFAGAEGEQNFHRPAIASQL